MCRIMPSPLPSTGESPASLKTGSMNCGSHSSALRCLDVLEEELGDSLEMMLVDEDAVGDFGNDVEGQIGRERLLSKDEGNPRAFSFAISIEACA